MTPFSAVVKGLEHGQGGYGATKWLGERAVLVAGGASPDDIHSSPLRPILPASGLLSSSEASLSDQLFVSVHRPGMITGHTRTGHSNATDYVNRILTACAQLGVCIAGPLPDHARLDMTPVDYVSGAIVALATAHGAVNEDGTSSAAANLSGSVYQFVNSAGSPKFDDVGLWIGRAGYACKPVPYAEFSKTLREEAHRDEGHALAPLLAYFPEASSFPHSIGMQVWGDASTQKALRLLSHDPAASPGTHAKAPLGSVFSAASSVVAAGVEPELPEPGLPVSSRLVLRPPTINHHVIRRTLVSLALRGHAPPLPTSSSALGSESSSDDEETVTTGEAATSETRVEAEASLTIARRSAPGSLLKPSRGATASLHRVDSGTASTSGEAVFGQATRIANAIAPSASALAAADSSVDTARAPTPTQARTHARTVRMSNKAKLAKLASAVENNPGVDFDQLVRTLDD